MKRLNLHIPQKLIVPAGMFALLFSSATVHGAKVVTWSCTATDGTVKYSDTPLSCRDQYPFCMPSGAISADCSTPFPAELNLPAPPPADPVPVAEHDPVPGALKVIPQPPPPADPVLKAAAEKQTEDSMATLKKLRTTMQYAMDVHNSAVQFYNQKFDEKFVDATGATQKKWEGYKKLTTDESYIKLQQSHVAPLQRLEDGDDAYAELPKKDSEVSGPKETQTLEKPGPNQVGSSGASKMGKFIGNAASDDDIRGLLRSSAAARQAQLMHDIQLRDKVIRLISAKGTDISNPEIVKLADSLNKAQAALNSSDRNRVSTANLVERAHASTSLFGDGKKQPEQYSLLDEQPEGEVARLLASANEKNAAVGVTGVPLFDRVHTTLIRNMVRESALSNPEKR